MTVFDSDSCAERSILANRWRARPPNPHVRSYDDFLVIRRRHRDGPLAVANLRLAQSQPDALQLWLDWHRTATSLAADNFGPFGRHWGTGGLHRYGILSRAPGNWGTGNWNAPAGGNNWGAGGGGWSGTPLPKTSQKKKKRRARKRARWAQCIQQDARYLAERDSGSYHFAGCSSPTTILD
ncbi:hypothetical protein B0H15DRAFT_801077 [Mycena belliarum]|uniref:Uncharacterized protein n=1 Tax=Mycena belliarum TaxID=1033014 RepID=A0AAD6U844_9AGAR|nr:hypothetical protein B0H15DRAFT_801077 [Mycena belliae]